MSDVLAAKRYAEALFQLGNEKSTLNEYTNDLKVVREVIQDNEELIAFLSHPKVNDEQKEELITGSLQGLHTDVVNTVKILVSRNRTTLIPSIVEAFTDLVNDKLGIEVATVYSVRELTDDEKEALSTSFANRIGKSTLEFENVIDPALMGGIKIRVGNTIYDGSIQGKLQRIERDIKVANR